MTRSFALVVATAALTIACKDMPVEPAPAFLAPHFNFLNGPHELPNVLRHESQFAFGVADPATDLIAFAGLPDDPARSVACGGTDPFAAAAIQSAGVLQGVIHSLVKAEGVNLDVYRLSTFRGICLSTPLAQGTGRIVVNDNDLLVTGEGANTWGFRMHGPVELATGGTAHLEAHNRFIIWPDGTFERIYRKVRLSGR